MVMTFFDGEGKEVYASGMVRTCGDIWVETPVSEGQNQSGRNFLPSRQAC
jgi:hypothetical protein